MSVKNIKLGLKLANKLIIKIHASGNRISTKRSSVLYKRTGVNFSVNQKFKILKFAQVSLLLSRLEILSFAICPYLYDFTILINCLVKSFTLLYFFKTAICFLATWSCSQSSYYICKIVKESCMSATVQLVGDSAMNLPWVSSGGQLAPSQT